MGSIHKSLAILLLDFLKTMSHRIEKESSGSPVDPFVLPADLVAFASFVKVDERGAGKHGNRKHLPYITYALRSLSVYVSDLVETLKLEPVIEKAGPESSELGQNFEKAILFLEYIDSVLDVHKCNDESIVKEAGPVQTLG